MALLTWTAASPGSAATQRLISRERPRLKYIASTYPKHPFKTFAMASSEAYPKWTKEEYLDKIQMSYDEACAKDPEMAKHPALQQSTYVPALDLIVACQEHLDDAAWERFNAAMGRYVGKEPAPAGVDVFDDVRGECRGLLEGRPDLQAQWDEVYGNRASWEKIHEAVKAGEEQVERAKAAGAGGA